jgi:hypothetical protein
VIEVGRKEFFMRIFLFPIALPQKYIFIFLSAFLCISGTASGDSDEDCFRLLEALQNPPVFSNMPEKVRAGDFLNLDFSVNISDPRALDSWEEVELTAIFSNAIPGSAEISFPIQLKYRSEVRSFHGMIRTQIRENLGGMYQQRALQRLRATRPGESDCSTSYSVPLPQRPEFRVENDPENVDIDPPILSQFTFQSSEVVAGSSVRLTFLAKDKSLLCTREAESQRKCVAKKWHQSVISTTGGNSLFFESKLEQSESGQYYFDFKIPPQAPPGTYELNQIFVGDVHGNSVESPRGVQIPRFTVVE